MVMGEVERDVERCDTCQYVEGSFDSHWRSVSLRNVYLYFFLQAFTRKSKNPCRFKNFQEYPRFYEQLGYS